MIAFSDPLMRSSLEGQVILPGHVGTIYQASNASYLGRSSARTLDLDDAGQIISPRLLSKLRTGESGHAYALEELLRRGAPVPRLGEAMADYVTRARSCFRQLRHPGCHGYVFELDRRLKKLPSLHFPKQPDPVQLGLL